MTRLEDAVRDALRNPPVQATVPADPLRVLQDRMRRVRRARVLSGGGLAMAAALAVLGLALLIASASPSTSPPAASSPPDVVVDAARTMLTSINPGYTVTGPAEWVRTTGREYGRLAGFGGSGLDYEVYVVQLHGRFVCGACTRPPGFDSPTGTALTRMFPVHGEGGHISFGVGPPLDLTRLGPVHEFPAP
jgi:hypothetical protein